MPRPRIALVTARDVSNARAWSGTHGQIAAALARHVGDVTPLGPSTPAILNWLHRLDRWSRRVSGIGYAANHSLVLARAYATFFAARLASGRYDIVFAPAAATEIAYLRTPLPIVYLSDATFAAMIDYYPAFTDLSRWSRFEGNRIEARAIARANAIIYSNDWAARSARTTYAAPAEKIHVIPFGANLDGVPARADVMSPGAAGRCRLLFVGRDWRRKGGDIAYDTLRHLRTMGIDADLTVCGPANPPPIADANVRFVPQLDQHVAADRMALADIYRQSTVFLLPTRAECSAVAFCEASAFGLPIVSTDTGGVAGIVQDGVTGRLLPPIASGPDYARVIRELLADPVGLTRMRSASRDAYETRLNWDAWGAAAGDAIRAVLGAGAAPALAGYGRAGRCGSTGE